MKRLFLFLSGIILIFTFSQCTKGDDIGDLYGRWKLVKFECPAFKEMPDSIFIGFQGHNYSYQPNYRIYDWGMYELKSNTFCFLPMQWGTDFEKIHVKEKRAVFKIELMNSNDLVLSRNDSVWTFRKFL